MDHWSQDTMLKMKIKKIWLTSWNAAKEGADFHREVCPQPLSPRQLSILVITVIYEVFPTIYVSRRCTSSFTRRRMVLLTVTESMLSAMKYCSEYQVQGWPLEQLEGEPSLKHANIGQPIAHGQVIALSQCLWKRFELHKNEGNGRQPKGITYDLNGLLRGSKVYSEPPKPKKEPVSYTSSNNMESIDDCRRQSSRH